MKSAAWTLLIVLATTALTIYCVIEFYKMWNLSLTISFTAFHSEQKETFQERQSAAHSEYYR